MRDRATKKRNSKIDLEKKLFLNIDLFKEEAQRIEEEAFKKQKEEQLKKEQAKKKPARELLSAFLAEAAFMQCSVSSICN